MEWLVGILVLCAASIAIGAWIAIRNAGKARKLEEELRSLPDFNAADVYVSSWNVAAVAIDRERRELALADANDLLILPISSIVSCEILEDGVQLAYANRASQPAGVAVGGALLGGVGAVVGGLSGSSRSANNVAKVVLRFVTDDFDKPKHDIVLLDWSSKKGMRRGNPVYMMAIETAELWHARVMAMMKADGRS